MDTNLDATGLIDAWFFVERAALEEPGNELALCRALGGIGFGLINGATAFQRENVSRQFAPTWRITSDRAIALTHRIPAFVLRPVQAYSAHAKGAM